MQRMQGKETGNHKAPPQATGGLAQEKKQEQCIGRMEKHAGQMMPGRIAAEKPAVQHVGKPCQRVPVGSAEAAESPDKPFPC